MKYTNHHDTGHMHVMECVFICSGPVHKRSSQPTWPYLPLFNNRRRTIAQTQLTSHLAIFAVVLTTAGTL